MAKIKLGARPKSFKRKVEFAMLDGTVGVIEVEFKYRTRTEFGRMIDELLETAKASTDAPADVKAEMFELMSRTTEANADYVLQIAQGWNLDEEFNRENIQQLGDEIPAAVAAIMADYRSAVTEGRLGN